MKRGTNIAMVLPKKLKSMDYFDENNTGNAVSLPFQNEDTVNLNLMNSDDKYEAHHSDLVELAQSIENAHNNIKVSTVSKLKVIQEQMIYLRKQAENILIEAKLNDLLHSLPCNFQKRVGHVYHVYMKCNQKYFSMLSPEEWGEIKDKYLGSFKLETDSSWTLVRKGFESDIMDNIYFNI